MRIQCTDKVIDLTNEQAVKFSYMLAHVAAFKTKVTMFPTAPQVPPQYAGTSVEFMKALNEFEMPATEEPEFKALVNRVAELEKRIAKVETSVTVLNRVRDNLKKLVQGLAGLAS